jgi:hypothetical protein
MTSKFPNERAQADDLPSFTHLRYGVLNSD